MSTKSNPGSPSPYAAPNTPIASAKRARTKTVKGSGSNSNTNGDLKSPKANASSSGSTLSPMRIGTGLSVDIASARASAGTSMPTPSKIMFSPAHRDTHGITATSRYYIENHSRHGNDAYSSTHYSYQNDNPALYKATTASTMTPPKSNFSRLHVKTPEEERDRDRVEVQVNNAVEEEEEEEEEEEVFNPYYYIAHLPVHKSVTIRDKICLPPINDSMKGKRTLVLDLDETLVHCTVKPVPNPDLVFSVTFNGSVYQVYVRKRPFLDQFLRAVAQDFEVVVFTASQKVYADVLLDKLDPKGKYISSRLFRDACLLVQGNYVKDLAVLGRDPKTTLLVDNSPHAYGYQIDNGVPIESWYDDDHDTELLKLLDFLKRLDSVDDVRRVIRNHFKTYKLIEDALEGLPFVNVTVPF